MRVCLNVLLAIHACGIMVWSVVRALQAVLEAREGRAPFVGHCSADWALNCARATHHAHGRARAESPGGPCSADRALGCTRAVHHAHGRARAGRDGPGEHAHRHARLHQPAVAGRQHHARLLRPLLRPLHVQRGARACAMACSCVYTAVRAPPATPRQGQAFCAQVPWCVQGSPLCNACAACCCSLLQLQ